MSFSEWQRKADGLARVLVERGVSPGDRVALVLPSSIDYASGYGAIVRAGAIATGLSMRLGPREFEAILAKADPSLIIAESAAGAPTIPAHYAVLDRSELSAAYDNPELGGDRPRREATDPVVIIWTSGTTGVPKGAWFDHRNLAAAVKSAGVMSGPFDRRLVATPFQHPGYMVKIWDQLAWGSTIVISPTPWTAPAMLDLLMQQKINVAGGVPTQWAKLLELPGIEQMDFSHVRLGLVATAPAAPELIQRVTAGSAAL